MKVGVINYGIGNLGSVARALEELRVSPRIIDNPADAHAVDRLILPGVGAFGECKARLDATGWTAAIQDQVRGAAKPLLGICLGMQLLADGGTEGAPAGETTPGLGLIPGIVRSLPELGCALRSPHMGWNSLHVKDASSILRGIPDGTDFYFVHSYALESPDRDVVLASTNYGIDLTAVVGSGRVWGTQFHPERSSKAGFQILRNFIDLATC